MARVSARLLGFRGFRRFILSSLTASLACALWAVPVHAANTPGTAPGQFSVSPTGAATYQIAIPVPPGVNGLKPSLALLYNSQAGNGLLGQGWSLSGLSVISHCPQTIDQDGVAIRPQDLNTDRLCLDGQRLVLVSGTYGAVNSTYRTEIDSFRLITVTAVQPGTAGGPLSFTVLDRSGLTSVYSTILAGGNGGGVPLQWLITSTTDKYGNFINFNYSFQSAIPTTGVGESETVSKIVYGNGLGVAVGKVVFGYSSGLRADSFSRTFAFTLVEENPVKLNSITVEDGSNNVLSVFNLGYQDANLQASAPSPTQLKSVQECGSDGTCYPATAFNYDGSASGFAAGGSSNFKPLGFTANKYMVGDFDGDGLPDYVYGYNGAYYVEFGNNPGVDIQIPVGNAVNNEIGITLANAVTMDVKGDGKQELFVQYFANPGAQVDLPVWKMLVWNGQTGSAENLVQVDVPTTDGQPLQVCKSTNSNCGSVLALALDASRRGQTGLLYEDGQEIYYYANVNGKLDDNLSHTDTGVGYQALYGGTPGMTPVNYYSQGQAQVYIAGTGIVGWDTTAQAFKFQKSGNFGEASFGTNSWVFFLDSTSSGLTDAVFVGGTQWGVSHNTGGGFAFGNSISTCATAPAGLDTAQAQPIDWFGDGRQELIVPAPTSSGGTNTWYLFEVSPLGCSFVNTGITVPSYDSGSQIRLIDVNDDGQVDITYTTNGQTGFLLSQSAPFMVNQITDGLGHGTSIGYIPLGAESLGAYVSNPFPSNLNAPQTRSYMGAMEIVKDYAVDSGTFDTNGNALQIYTYYLYGGATIEQWGRGFQGFSEVQAINFNTGIYTTDIYNQNFPISGTVASSTKTWKQDPGTPTTALYTTNVTHNGGFKVTCGNVRSAEPTCDIANPPPSYTIQTSFVTGGNTISVTTSGYTDAYASNQVYAGVYSPYASSSTTQLFDINSPGSAYETTTTNTTNSIVSTSTPIGADVMPTDITVSTQDNTPGNSTDSNTVETKSDYSAWEATCPGRPGTVTVIHSSPAVPNGLTQTETFAYDGNCFLIEDDKNIIDPAGSAGYPMTSTKRFVADSFGNPFKVKVSGTKVSGNSQANTQRVTTMTYDSTGRFPVTIANPYGQTETLTYDSWGSKLTDTDANQNTVTYTYDGFERKKTQSGPLPALNTTWTYGACTTNCVVSNVAYQATQTGSDGSSATTEYDQMGRPLRDWHIGFNGETIEQDTQYDLLGRAVFKGAPTKTTTICWDQKVYDVLNRLATEYQPLNSGQCALSGNPNPTGERKITTSYSGLTTTRTVTVPATGASPTSETTVTTVNVLGKAASVQDPGGAAVPTTYAYDVWGNLTSVTPPDGAQVSMSYDSIGDKLSMHDPDMGSWTYTYDALGELLTQTDAKGQTVTNQYDWLGRLFDRVEPEGETRWVYDIAYGAGVGKLAYTVGPNGVWEGYAYDGFGETTDKITVVGGQEYWVTNTYDAQGRVAQVVYPNMSAVNVSGTPAAPTGLTVAQVLNPDNSTSFNLAWTLNSANQNGQIFRLYRTPSTITTPSQGYEIYSGPVPNWQDNTVTKDDTYTWWLQACNGDNCSGYISQSKAVVLPPTVPVPVAPAAVQQAASWSVTWSASNLGVTGNPGTISYVLQRSYNGGAWAQVYSGAGTSADGGITYSSGAITGNGDGSYSYRTQACASGACSNFSAATGAVTIAIQPSAPQSVSAPATVTPTTSPASIPVTWTAPAVNGGTANLSYTVTIFKNSVQQSVTAPQSTAGYTDTESQDGIYSYTVKVCDTTNTALCATASSGNAALTLPPSSPGTPTVYSDSHTPTWSISWTPSTLSSGSSGSISYYVVQYWSGASGFTNVQGAQTLSGGLYWATATAILQGGYYQDGTYTYAVDACTTDPATGGTACTQFTPVSAGYVTTIAPGVPTYISVPPQSNGDGSFTVTYSPPAANTGGVVTKYAGQVYDTACSPSGCIPVVEATCTSTTTSCSFPANKLPAGSDYSLQIRAVNNGVPSAWVQESEPNIWYIGTPAAPTLTSPNYTGTVSMSWTNVSGANSYNLYQSTDGTNFTFQKNVTSGSGSTSTSVSGLGDGTYYYKVAACQTSTICGSNSAASSVSVLLPPGAPTGLGISPSTSNNGSFTLSWTAPATATQYRVYQSTNGGNYVWVDTFNNSNSGTITRAESGLANGNYSYYVYAWNAAGQGPASNTVSGTVLLPPTNVSINETDAGDGSHYTISWSASGATSYNLYFAHATQTGPWSAWAAVSGYSPTTATSDYTQSALANYNLEYYVQACNASGCTNSGAISFVNPKEVTGCMTCSGIKPTAPAPSPVPPPPSGKAASLVPNNLGGLSLPEKLASVRLMPATRVSASAPELLTLKTLALNATTLPDPRSLKRIGLPQLSLRMAAARRPVAKRSRNQTPASQLLASANLSPRQAYFLAHAGRTTAPKPKHLRMAHRPKPEQVIATAQYAPAVDVILSLYPPLRQDPRVLAHFVARGGALPAQVRNASASVDCRDTDSDVECTTPDSPNALMVGYHYNGSGYLDKVEKLNANGTAIGELWQPTDETAFGKVDQQVFDAAEGSTSGAFSVNDNYDTGTGILNGTSVTAADTTGGASSLSAAYTWDGYSNLLTRTLSETVPSGQTGASSLSESFTYDAVNRMTGVTDSAGNGTAMSYNAVGGFQSNGLYTNYQYGSPDSVLCTNYPFGPAHAVSSLSANGTTRKFCYDADGNMKSESGDVTRSINWMSYNKPYTVTSGTTTETFTYGPSRERLQTTVTTPTDTVTTTYIDGLFEQVADSASGGTTYKHYIIAGSARVGVETIQVNSGGTATSDTLSFYVGDQIGGVIATVTENLGGTGQQLAVYSHDPWGKARPTSGTGANIALLPGVFQPSAAVMKGQHEGFAGHEDLEDIGIVDMEGRIYDPEIGRFLSADPTVEYPDSSQGYNRYVYCNSNPLSLSDPTGYSWIGDKTQEAMHVAYYGFMAFFLYEGLGKYGWNAYAAAFGSAAITGYESSGGNVHTAIMAGLEAMAFTYVGGYFKGDLTSTQIFERSAIEGVIGGAFTKAGGGNFGDGFFGAFAGSEASPYVGEIGGDPKTTADYFSPINEMSRMAVSAIVGGTASSLTGGKFTDGAIAGAMQRLFNDDDLKNQGATVRLRRIRSTDSYTLDELTVDGTNIKGYALEPSGPSSEKEGSDKRIDSGTYALVKHSGKDFKGVYELTNVPGRSYILIHWGNFADDTLGCILPGSSYGEFQDPSTGDTEFGVTNSRAFVQELDSYLNQFPNNRVVIEGSP